MARLTRLNKIKDIMDIAEIKQLNKMTLYCLIATMSDKGLTKFHKEIKEKHGEKLAQPE
jgi:hypothetical protein